MEFTYCFNQLRSNEEGTKAQYLSYDATIRLCGGVDLNNYFTADFGTIKARSPEAACEELYSIYLDPDSRPLGYDGRRISVSDVIDLWDNSNEPSTEYHFFCDHHGFKHLEV